MANQAFVIFLKHPNNSVKKGSYQWILWKICSIDIQDASYYKMLGSISWPKIGSEQTTGPIVMKFGRDVPDIILFKLIEAIFEILPLAWDIGPHRGDR